MNANNTNNNIDNDSIILKVCFSLSAFHTGLTVTTMSLYLLQLPNKALRLADYLHHDSWQSINQMTDTISSNKVSLLNENRRRERKPSHKRQSISLEARLLKIGLRCLSDKWRWHGFSSHENQPFPSSLSYFGQLCKGNISDLVACMEPLALVRTWPTTDAAILDGALLLWTSSGLQVPEPPASNVSVPYIHRELQ